MARAPTSGGRDLAPTSVRRLAYSTSRASDDLPEPDTPVTTTSRPSGMRTSMSRRLCRLAASISSASLRPLVARRGAAGWRSGRARNRPVTDSGLRCSACAVPAATTRPPRTPAPGPKSMM